MNPLFEKMFKDRQVEVMKNPLKCPNCKRWLPQIGMGDLLEGESVNCGLCNHIWTPNKSVQLPDENPAQLSCPKCNALTLNIDIKTIIAAKGVISCEHCGHERKIKALKK